MPERCFSFCKKLANISFPSTLTQIELAAFMCTNFKKLDLGNLNVEEIGDRVFKECGNLSEIVLPQNLKSLGNHAFNGTNITEFHLPDSLINIKDFIYGTKAKSIYYRNLNKQTLNNLKDILNDLYLNNYNREIKLIPQDIDTLLEESRSFKEINNIYKKNPVFAR